MTSGARHLWVLAPLLVSTGAVGCSSGCGDEVRADLVQVQLDRTTVGDGREVRVTLCQDDRCETLTAPATQYVVDVSVSELAVDLDEPGELRVEVVDARGREIAESSAGFDFEVSGGGAGCPSVREQEVTVTAR